MLKLKNYIHVSFSSRYWFWYDGAQTRILKLVWPAGRQWLSFLGTKVACGLCLICSFWSDAEHMRAIGQATQMPVLLNSCYEWELSDLARCMILSLTYHTVGKCHLFLRLNIRNTWILGLSNFFLSLSLFFKLNTIFTLFYFIFSFRAAPAA